jgi:hypothetical protein
MYSQALEVRGLATRLSLAVEAQVVLQLNSSTTMAVCLPVRLILRLMEPTQLLGLQTLLGLEISLLPVMLDSKQTQLLPPT